MRSIRKRSFKILHNGWIQSSISDSRVHTTPGKFLLLGVLQNYTKRWCFFEFLSNIFWILVFLLVGWTFKMEENEHKRAFIWKWKAFHWKRDECTRKWEEANRWQKALNWTSTVFIRFWFCFYTVFPRQPKPKMPSEKKTVSKPYQNRIKTVHLVGPASHPFFGHLKPTRKESCQRIGNLLFIFSWTAGATKGIMWTGRPNERFWYGFDTVLIRFLFCLKNKEK